MTRFGDGGSNDLDGEGGKVGKMVGNGGVMGAMVEEGIEIGVELFQWILL